MLAAVKKLETPSVLVNRYLDMAHPHVILNDFNGAKALVKYLPELNHKRIAFVGGLGRFLGARRVAGYTAALEEAGIAFDPNLAIESGYDREGGESALSRLLQMPQRPTAVFAANHLVAAGLMLEAQQRGLQVPRDLSVASFYDGLIAELVNPSFTAVSFSLDKLGYESARMLADLIEGVDLTRRSVTIPHERIVVRQSTAAV